MHIIFTEQELEHIDKKPFDWTIKPDCPDKLANAIKRKFKLLREGKEK